MISKTQIDRLGDRLRSASFTDDDLRQLDEYRREFSEAYEAIVGAIRYRLGLEPTGRPAKSTRAIREKLLRESIRLSQVQDIAGCRIVVPGIAEQNETVERVRSIFRNATVIDRREHPSHGYRAVHVIVKECGKLVEVQIRTALQHSWAELSEKASDLIDPDIKYGGGDLDIQRALLEISSLFAKVDHGEYEYAELQAQVKPLLAVDRGSAEALEKVKELRQIMDNWRQSLITMRNEIMRILEED